MNKQDTEAEARNAAWKEAQTVEGFHPSEWEPFEYAWNAALAYARPGWVSVEERLPDVGDMLTSQVLVAIETDFTEKEFPRGYDIACYSPKWGWSINNDDHYSGNPRVIAWMPLQEPFMPLQGQQGEADD